MALKQTFWDHQCFYNSIKLLGYFSDPEWWTNTAIFKQLKPIVIQKKETNKEIPMFLRWIYDVIKRKLWIYSGKIIPLCHSKLPFFMHRTVESLTLVFRCIKDINLASSRCLFSLHTRLGRSQRRQCETLQDPQAWQRGILYHYTSTVWHITEACQTLYRYVVCIYSF